ncbi:MAG TPA: TetR/AcrR family transcriptional regulator [Dictyobacter sp.]|nr:TetR/AcrR family transcriptional regulator [Dictyobacter sp.]
MARIDIRSIRRKQIIQAAEELAAENGWAETTITDICHHAHISTGVLTYHFKDKDDIMFAVLEDVIARLREHFQPLEEIPQTLEAIATACVNILIQVAEDDHHLSQLLMHFITSSAHRPKIAHRLHALFAEMRQRQANELAAHSENNDVFDHDPLIFISVLHSLALGIILGRTVLGIDLPATQLIEEAKILFMKSINQNDKIVVTDKQCMQ